MSSLISIIVPIYKVENYLEKCIESILNQTYKDIEIILVDDGSPDNCGKICDEYAKKDKRIKVIHKQNGGLSDARNFGIDLATGEYIIFVDSDDYIDRNMCRILLNYAKKYDADIVSCNFKDVYVNNVEKINKQCINKNLEIVSNIKALYKYFLKNTTDMVVVWNKLYKKKVFFDEKNVRFPKGKLHEDMYTTYKLYYYASKIVFIDDILYYYFRHKDSITGSISKKNLLDKIDAVIEQYEFFKDKKIDLKYMTQIKCIDSYIEFLKIKHKMMLNDKILNNKMISLKKCILFNKKDVLKNSYMNWKKYIKFILIYINAKWVLKKI